MISRSNDPPKAMSYQLAKSCISDSMRRSGVSSAFSVTDKERLISVALEIEKGMLSKLTDFDTKLHNAYAEYAKNLEANTKKYAVLKKTSPDRAQSQLITDELTQESKIKRAWADLQYQLTKEFQDTINLALDSTEKAFIDRR